MAAVAPLLPAASTMVPDITITVPKATIPAREDGDIKGVIFDLGGTLKYQRDKARVKEQKIGQLADWVLAHFAARGITTAIVSEPTNSPQSSPTSSSALATLQPSTTTTSSSNNSSSSSSESKTVFDGSLRSLFMVEWRHILRVWKRHKRETKLVMPEKTVPMHLKLCIETLFGEDAFANHWTDDDAKRATEVYFEAELVAATLYPGVMDMLQTLTDQGLALAVVTNSTDTPKQLATLEILKVKHFFDPIVVSAEVGFRKPDSRIFRIVFDLWEKKGLHFARDEVVTVGDMLSRDVLGAQRMGMRSVLIEWPGEVDKSNVKLRDKLHADRVITHMNELPGAIQSITEQWRAYHLLHGYPAVIHPQVCDCPPSSLTASGSSLLVDESSSPIPSPSSSPWGHGGGDRFTCPIHRSRSRGTRAITPPLPSRLLHARITAASPNPGGIGLVAAAATATALGVASQQSPPGSTRSFSAAAAGVTLSHIPSSAMPTTTSTTAAAATVLPTLPELPASLLGTRATPFFHPLRIGYAMGARKAASMNWFDTEYREDAAYVPVDITKPLETQGPFDVLLMKLTDEMQRPESGEVIKRFRDYIAAHPSMVVVDPFENVELYLDRVEIHTSLIAGELKTAKGVLVAPPPAGMINLPLPPNVDITKVMDDVSITVTVPVSAKEKKKKSENKAPATVKIPFPVICKRVEACGSVESHHMVIVAHSSGMAKLEAGEWLVQQYINHDRLLYKVYVFGDETVVIGKKNQSLPNLDISVQRDNIDVDSRLLRGFAPGDDPSPDGATADTTTTTSPAAAAAAGATPELVRTSSVVFTPPALQDAIHDISQQLRQRWGVSLFGLDVIEPSRGQPPPLSPPASGGEAVAGAPQAAYYIVDANHLPSYNGVPDFPQRLLNFLCDYWHAQQKPRTTTNAIIASLPLY